MAQLLLRIFIDYREDARGPALLIYDRLANTFGSENVVFTPNLPRVMSRLQEIKSRPGSRGVLLTLIGPSWMSIMEGRQQQARGQTAMGEPEDDYVRSELEYALKRSSGIHVIPVLLGDDVPFTAEGLPRSLQPVTRIEAERVRQKRFEDDIAHLIDRLKTIARLEGHGRGAPIVAASLAPDASWAWTVEPGRVRAWANGAMVCSWDSASIRADMPAAVAGGSYEDRDEVMRAIWVADGRIQELTSDFRADQSHRVSAPVRALGLSPSGRLAVLACDHGILRGVDTERWFPRWFLDGDTGELDWEPAAYEPPARAVAVASDRGPIVAVFADGSIRRYDVEAGTSELVGVGPPAQAVAITRDGEVVVTAGADGLLQWWSQRAGAKPERRMLEAVITAVSLDATGDWVLVGTDDGRLSLYDLITDARVEYIPARAGPVRMAARPPSRPQMAARPPSIPQMAAQSPSGPLPTSSPPSPPLVDDDVRFTVYRPQVLPPGRWASLLVFAHKTDPVVEPGRAPVDPIKQVEERARDYFGAGMSRPVSVDARQGLGRGAQLRIVLDLPGISCNPQYQVVEWWEPVHEVRFRLLAGPDLAGAVVRGTVRVWYGALILGEVSIAMPVAANDLGADSAPAAESIVRYRKIFPSYSHQDSAIVQDFAIAAHVLGDQYLQDVITLHAGERWDSRLLQLIEEADVFQLFWSHNSMRSPHCRDEWEHALTLQRPLFIRPLYWEEPRPEDPGQQLPPPALQALHFVKVPRDPPVVVPSPGATAHAPQRSSPPATQWQTSPPPAVPPSAPLPTMSAGGPAKSRRTSLMLPLLIGLLIAVVSVVVAFQIIGR